MKKHFSKFLSLTIGVVMLVSLSVAAYADKPIAEPYIGSRYKLPISYFDSCSL